MPHIISLFPKILMVLIFCSQVITGKIYSQNVPVPYDLTQPSQSFPLPDSLHEISGLTLFNKNSFLCIQDENGIIFLVDTKTKKITGRFQFAADGDYEAIAKVKNTVYVLRSDGLLFEVSNFSAAATRTQSYLTEVPATNSEGLCWDAKHNRLLIGCKSKPAKGPEYKDIRVIYAFDLATKKRSPSPIFQFSVDALVRFAIQNNIPLPLKQKGKNIVPSLKFGMSEIAIHPITGELYLLSATDHLLLVFNNAGDIVSMFPLDPALFNKPEGIAFYDNGDMIITNEGQNGQATVLFFHHNKK